MTLYKFCKRAHNVALDCDTLRLGTLQEFREKDPSFSIADQWEGITNSTTDGKAINFSGAELTKLGLSIPAISIGSQGNVNLTGGMSTMFPNLYIFSVSIEEINSSLYEYDSKYSISEPQLFANELKRLFVEQFDINDYVKGDFVKSDFLDSEMTQLNVQFNIECFHGPVKYLKKPFVLSEENKMEILEIHNRPLKAYFTKAVEKINDNEYRFIIIPRIGERIISVKKEAKILNIKPLMTLLVLRKTLLKSF